MAVASVSNQLLENVRKVAGPLPTECWAWTRKPDRDGYGSCPLVESLPTRAHRRAWTVWRGVIPAGMHVLHQCDNPSCINPSHLWLGTPLDNARDRQRKGRGGQWKRAGTKLDVDKVRSLRRRREAGETLSQLAVAFGINTTTVWQIVKRRRWASVV